MSGATLSGCAGGASLAGRTAAKPAASAVTRAPTPAPTATPVPTGRPAPPTPTGHRSVLTRSTQHRMVSSRPHGTIGWYAPVLVTWAKDGAAVDVL